MRFVSLVFAVLLLPCVTPAQNNAELCPTMSVSGPAGVTTPSELVTFTAEIAGTAREDRKITYEWSITEGRIELGQGTSSIVVTAPSEFKNNKLLAAVEVEGLPKGCDNRATATAVLAAVPECGLAFEEYGKISANEERARLDNVAIAMSQNPNLILSVILFLEPTETRALAVGRVTRIQKRLVDARGADLKRIRYYFAESERTLTGFYLTLPEISDAPRKAFNAKNGIDELRPPTGKSPK